MSASYKMNTTEGDGIYTPFGVKVLAGMCVSMMVFLAVAGNLLVIISYIRDRKLRIVMNFYLLNLAIADLCIGLISLSFYSSYTIREVWLFGKAFCKFFFVNDFTMCLETVLLTVLISLDRLLLVTYGASYQAKETMKVAYVRVAVSWVFAFSLYGPAVILWDIVRGESELAPGECNVEFTYNFEYTFITAFCEFLIPFTLLTVFNASIYRAIRKRGKITPQRPKSVATIEGNTVNTAVAKFTDQIVERRNLRAAKALGILVLAFAVCWGPYSVATVVKAACGDCIGYHLYEFLTYLLWLKSAVNPILYAFSSERFRSNFVEILSFVCPCLKPKRKSKFSNMDT